MNKLNSSARFRIDGERSRTVKAQSPPAKAGPLNFKLLVLSLGFTLCFLRFAFFCFAQGNDLEFNLDVNSETTPLARVFRPYIDLSGRGEQDDKSWPQTIASQEVLNSWQENIGFCGIYRMQYNLWDINESGQDKLLRNKLLLNYEEIIKKINDNGGIVILDLFGTPAGMGRVLDKRCFPNNLTEFKALVKGVIRELSCNKKYNIWYEVWSAPDLDSFFLGRKQEYFSIYRAVAEAVKELESETKMHIPIGGPGVSWWFQNSDGNTIITPEGSLIYGLIRYCYSYHLPLDFITWHAYSTDPKAELEVTSYNSTAVALIRDWLSYFNFDKATPLIVDEWNYDSGANLLSARHDNANICSSYIPARINNMQRAGLDYQLYFCLEDFQNNKEHVVRNVGVFWLEPKSGDGYKGKPKSAFQVFKMISQFGNNMFVPQNNNDECVGIIATKEEGRIVIMIYNYIDPDLARNYLSRNVAVLTDKERKTLLNLIKSNKLEKILSGQTDFSSLATTKRLKTMLSKAQELNVQANILKVSNRTVNLNIKNLSDNYLYQRYTMDASCTLDCEMKAVEEKEINSSYLYQETLKMQPYSVQTIILKKKPKEEAAAAQPPQVQPEKENPEETGTALQPPQAKVEEEKTGNKGNIIMKPKEIETNAEAPGALPETQVIPEPPQKSQPAAEKTENEAPQIPKN